MPKARQSPGNASMQSSGNRTQQPPARTKQAEPTQGHCSQSSASDSSVLAHSFMFIHFLHFHPTFDFSFHGRSHSNVARHDIQSWASINTSQQLSLKGIRHLKGPLSLRMLNSCLTSSTPMQVPERSFAIAFSALPKLSRAFCLQFSATQATCTDLEPAMLQHYEAS